MPTGSNGGKERKRRVVARGVVAGKPTKAIAREAGIGERYAQRLAKEPATQWLITEILRPHHARLQKLAKKAIDAVDGALGAKLLRGGPNHEIRLRAVRRYRDLAEMAQGKPSLDVEDPNSNGILTWTEFELIYKERVLAKGDPAQPAPVE